MTTGGQQRWDPSQPAFVVDVLKTLTGLWIAVSVLGALTIRPWFGGLLTGGLLAIALYLVAIQAGKAVALRRGHARVLAGLLLQQLGIWVLMAILLNVVKVHPVAFVLGVSILPVAIIVTLIWYAVQNKRTPL